MPCRVHFERASTCAKAQLITLWPASNFVLRQPLKSQKAESARIALYFRMEIAPLPPLAPEIAMNDDDNRSSSLVGEVSGAHRSPAAAPSSHMPSSGHPSASADMGGGTSSGLAGGESSGGASATALPGSSAQEPGKQQQLLSAVTHELKADATQQQQQQQQQHVMESMSPEEMGSGPKYKRGRGRCVGTTVGLSPVKSFRPSSAEVLFSLFLSHPCKGLSSRSSLGGVPW